MQQQIINELNVTKPFLNDNDVLKEIQKRINFIKRSLMNSNLKTLVLGISGGVDSATAGKLCQLAINELRNENKDDSYKFIAVRLPYAIQQDEEDAQKSLKFIDADILEVVNIQQSTISLAEQITSLANHKVNNKDFVLGNIKARIRMVAQYAIANSNNGLVVGTDHAAEAVMGFFTKFGDGACDIAPLSSLTKRQVRIIASYLGAPDEITYKTPTADLEDSKPLFPDEQAFGISYSDIDDFLEGKTVDENSAKTIISYYNKTKHKRSMPLTP